MAKNKSFKASPGDLIKYQQVDRASVWNGSIGVLIDASTQPCPSGPNWRVFWLHVEDDDLSDQVGTIDAGNYQDNLVLL
jgi:hypothetical protein